MTRIPVGSTKIVLLCISIYIYIYAGRDFACLYSGILGPLRLVFKQWQDLGCLHRGVL